MGNAAVASERRRVMIESKKASEVEVGDWIWWGKAWRDGPVLDAFYSRLTLRRHRLVQVTAMKIYPDLEGRLFVVYEVDTSLLVPAAYQARRGQEGREITLEPCAPNVTESFPAHYLDEAIRRWINVEAN